MSKIRVLPVEISNRIAAGEVIERPASVVKELVENALDAGAGAIRVTVEGAGRRLIEVADDGCGMDQDDALLAFEIHGTSKISEADDIDRITSLGFRGEAIPTITAVSHLTLSTRERHALEGVTVRSSGSKLLDVRPSGGPPGTTIQVRDLFYNTPARKKFLKADATEIHHIEEMMMMLSLCYPRVAFSLTNDGRNVFSTPAANDLGPRVALFFGRTYAGSMTPVQFEDHGVSVSGFAAVPGFTRNTRREQRTFVNGRPVEAAAIYRGIREGYGVMPGHGRYQPVILFVTLDPHLVDVNVHPAKREVRFRSENQIAHAVASAIAEAINHASRRTAEPVPAEAIPSIARTFSAAEILYKVRDYEETTLPALEDAEKLDRWAPPVHGTPPPVHGTTDEPSVPEGEMVQASSSVTQVRQPEDPFIGSKPEITVPLQGLSSREHLPTESVRFPDIPETLLGILSDTYLLCQGPDGLILIDQHAAHERILYESLTSDSAESVPRQALLLPTLCELSRSAVSLLIRHKKELARLGFELEELSSNSVLINALPSSFPERDAAELLADMTNELLEESNARTQCALEQLARAACRAAVKAHDVLSMREGHELLRQLRQCRQGRLCPHGRPTLIGITLDELEKKFGRK